MTGHRAGLEVGLRGSDRFGYSLRAAPALPGLYFSLTLCRTHARHTDHGARRRETEG